MTLTQFTKLSETIAERLQANGQNPRTAYGLSFLTPINIKCRRSAGGKTGLAFGSPASNADLKISGLSNPNNPNYKYRSLNPGVLTAEISGHDGLSKVALSDCKFDPSQFAELVRAIQMA